MTFYLKYRPQKISDLDQIAVRESIKKIVDSQNIPQAFLFSGPKGTGKTSLARIIAKIVNCEKNEKKFAEPCNKCSSCIEIEKGANIDVIELDAASNRGIDDVRQIRDTVKLAPARSRKKVYIIDEAHMLTTEASNALLKTLEEPPSHVIFILATTNPEKLISTIRSRVTEIVYKPATIVELTSSLYKIVKGEKIKSAKKALEIIARYSDGSFRDAAKILEQLVSEKIKIDEKVLLKHFESSSKLDPEEILSFAKTKDLKKAVSAIEKASEDGEDLVKFFDTMLASVHEKVVNKVANTKSNDESLLLSDLIRLSDLMISSAEYIKISSCPELILESLLIKWVGKKNENIESEATKDEIPIDKKNAENAVVQKISREKVVRENVKVVNNDVALENDIWQKILVAVKNVNTSIEALLRATKPIAFDGKILKLGVFYKFHKERLEENKNRAVLEGVIESILTMPARVECVLTEPTLVSKKEDEITLKEPKQKDATIMEVAKDIFGS